MKKVNETHGDWVLVKVSPIEHKLLKRMAHHRRTNTIGLLQEMIENLCINYTNKAVADGTNSKRF